MSYEYEKKKKNNEQSNKERAEVVVAFVFFFRLYWKEPEWIGWKDDEIYYGC